MDHSKSASSDSSSDILADTKSLTSILRLLQRGTKTDEISLLNNDYVLNAAMYLAESPSDSSSIDKEGSSSKKGSHHATKTHLTLKDKENLLQLLTAIISSGISLEDEENIEKSVADLQETASIHVRESEEESEGDDNDDFADITTQWRRVDQAATEFLQQLSHCRTIKSKQSPKKTRSRPVRRKEKDSEESPLTPQRSPPSSSSSKSVPRSLAETIQVPSGTIISNSDDTVQFYTFGPVLTCGLFHMSFLILERGGSSYPSFGLIDCIRLQRFETAPDPPDNILMIAGTEYRSGTGRISSLGTSYRFCNAAAPVGTWVHMQLDLRSSVKQKRTLHWFVNHAQQKYSIFGLPKEVQFAACLLDKGTTVKWKGPEEGESIVEPLPGETTLKWW